MPPFTNEKVKFCTAATEFDGKVIISYTTTRKEVKVLNLLCTTDLRNWRPLKIPDGMNICFFLFSFHDHLYGAFWTDSTLAEEKYPALYKLTNVDGEWSKLPDGHFRQPQWGCATFVWKDKLLTIGGMGPDEQTLTAVEGFDLVNDVWCDPNMFFPLPKGLVLPQAINHNNKLHVIGGIVEGSTPATALEPNTTVYTCTSILLSAASNQPECKWISYLLPATPCGTCGVTSIDECPVVAGGCKLYPKELPSSEVFCLDADSNTWLQLPSLKVPRGAPSLLRFGDKLVAIGGMLSTDNEYSNRIEVMKLNI